MTVQSLVTGPTARAAIVALALGALSVAATGATGAELKLTILGLEDRGGHVRVEVCTEEQFLGEDCPYRAFVPAIPGETEVIVEDIPPGTYAAQIYHDANDNEEFDRNMVGWPMEGYAFSNDAVAMMRPPKWEEAQFEITEEGAEGSITMVYR